MTYAHDLKILNSDEKKQIINKLKNQFGVQHLNGIMTMSGRERLFLFQGNLNEKQIKKLEKTIPIERVGVYFGKEIQNKIRLSIDGIHLLKDQIIKDIFELDDKQAEEWMRGNEILIETGKNDFLIIKHKGDFLGCGKASEKKITNFVPKARRLKEKLLI